MVRSIMMRDSRIQNNRGVLKGMMYVLTPAFLLRPPDLESHGSLRLKNPLT